MTRRRFGEGTVEPSGRGWRVRVRVEGQRVDLGTFATEEEAETARVAYTKKRPLGGAPKLRARPIVYFIEDIRSGAIKIGRSRNVATRLRAFSTSAPERPILRAAIPGGQEFERAIQIAFNPDRIRGEWFNPSPRLLALIEEIRAVWGAP